MLLKVLPQYLKEIAEQVKIPCLRKDFTVDEYMIYEAKLLGASAILLICSLLTEREIKKYLEICEELGLSALVEVHDEREIERALRAGSRVIGVNNRNLKDFTVDTSNSKRLADKYRRIYCLWQKAESVVQKMLLTCIK